MLTIGNASMKAATQFLFDHYEDAGARGGFTAAGLDGTISTPPDIDAVIDDVPIFKVDGKAIYRWLDRDVYIAWRSHVATKN